jgi:hypothetical protein
MLSSISAHWQQLSDDDKNSANQLAAKPKDGGSKEQ